MDDKMGIEKRLGSTLRPRAIFRLAPLTLALAGSWAMAADAVNLGPDTTLNYSLTLSYTASMRTKSAASEYLNDLNNDDGTRNFDRWSLFTNRVNALGELRLRHDNLGAILRGSTFYDWSYRGRNDNDSIATVNKLAPSDQFVARTRKLSGNDSRLLDAYAYGSWSLGDERSLSLKVGRHVLAWGESLFWPNISQGQVPVDATKFNIPGTEAKEAYLPVGQVSGALTLNSWATLTGFVQYKWEETRLNPVGDYFGSDYFGPGAQFFRLAPGQVSALPDHSFAVVNYAGDIKPKDSGQWGIGGRFIVSEATEIGLYHYRYHERVGALMFDFTGTTQYSSLPRFGSNASPGSTPYYKLGYFDDVKLTGASLSTKFGDAVQLGADLSYRNGSPVYLSPASGNAPARGQLAQLNVNFLYTLGPSAIARTTTLLGEVAHQRIMGVDALTISGGLPGSNGTFRQYVYDGQTRGSTLLGVGAVFDHGSVMPGWDLGSNVTWTQNVQGSSFGGMGRAEKRLTLGANLMYLRNFTVGLTYVAYLGSPNIAAGRLLADRDYLSLNVKHTF